MKTRNTIALALALTLTGLTGAVAVQAQTYKVIHNFGGAGDGYQPVAPLVLDPRGDLYGTTLIGGTGQFGTVFKLAPNGDGTWTESVLQNFNMNGDQQYAPVALDLQGDLYGETPGTGNGPYGSVYELTPNGDGTWNQHTIHAFTGGTDGQGPSGGVTLGSNNQLFGVAENGETRHDGFVFSFSHISVTDWFELFLHTFTGGSDGMNPSGPLTLDAAGNLYGVAAGGPNGNGLVYKLTPNQHSFGWTKSLVYAFAPPLGTPNGDLMFDAAGNLYGTCFEDGTYGYGLVYNLSPNGDGTWSETTLYNFKGVNQQDGELANAGLVMDSAGNLYGTTVQGGTGCNGNGCGIIFKLTPSNGQWTESIAYYFTAGTGWQPHAGLVQDRAGNLYGTTVYGGTNGNVGGVAYEFTPAH